MDPAELVSTDLAASSARPLQGLPVAPSVEDSPPPSPPSSPPRSTPSPEVVQSPAPSSSPEVGIRREDDLDVDGHHKFCYLCGDGGDLVVCEGCPNSVHAGCAPKKFCQMAIFIALFVRNML